MIRARAAVLSGGFCQVRRTRFWGSPDIGGRLFRVPAYSNWPNHAAASPPLWCGRSSEVLPYKLENSAAQLDYLLEEEGKPFGRIYVVFTPALRLSDNSPVVKVDITARGKPRGNSAQDAFQLLDLEREAVVTTFTAVTTRDLHKIWGRIDADN